MTIEAEIENLQASLASAESRLAAIEARLQPTPTVPTAPVVPDAVKFRRVMPTGQFQ